MTSYLKLAADYIHVLSIARKTNKQIFKYLTIHSKIGINVNILAMHRNQLKIV